VLRFDAQRLVDRRPGPCRLSTQPTPACPPRCRPARTARQA